MFWWEFKSTFVWQNENQKEQLDDLNKLGITYDEENGGFNTQVDSFQTTH